MPLMGISYCDETGHADDPAKQHLGLLASAPGARALDCESNGDLPTVRQATYRSAGIHSRLSANIFSWIADLLPREGAL